MVAYTLLYALSILAINPWGASQGAIWVLPKVLILTVLLVLNGFTLFRHAQAVKVDAAWRRAAYLWMALLGVGLLSTVLSPAPRRAMFGQSIYGDGWLYWLLVGGLVLTNALVLRVTPELFKAQLRGLLLGGVVFAASIFPQLLDDSLDYTVRAGQSTPTNSELLLSGVHVNRQVVCSLKRVKRLMRQAGIYALPERKYRRRKTLETLSAAATLLVPKPDLVKVNQVWYSDITFVKTAEGWLYLAAVMDAYSKRIVGYAMNDNMKTDLVIQALRMARTQRRVSRGLIHHSDKGSQYTSYAYQHELAAQGTRPSFTGTGACLDNAYIESFFATLKKELVYQSFFATREEAKLAVSEFINMYYNSWRLHSSLGYRCPNDFEAQGLERLAA